MELCEKGNLLEVLREPSNAFGLPEEEYLRFFSHLVFGMKHLRQNGFSHRDIKPGNILVCIADDGSIRTSSRRPSLNATDRGSLTSLWTCGVWEPHSITPPLGRFHFSHFTCAGTNIPYTSKIH
eukprot:XP_019924088.1 PREDICTED: inhibitor of nuclear factor kappa-B kinase subunit epsilon-like [Crassostrea gigas]